MQNLQNDYLFVKWIGQNAGNTNEVPFISLKDVGCGNNWGSPSDPQIVYCQFNTDLLDGLEDMGPVDSITLLLMGTNEQETSVLIGNIFLTFHPPLRSYSKQGS